MKSYANRLKISKNKMTSCKSNIIYIYIYMILIERKCVLATGDLYAEQRGQLTLPSPCRVIELTYLTERKI